MEERGGMEDGRAGEVKGRKDTTGECFYFVTSDVGIVILFWSTGYVYVYFGTKGEAL